MTARRSVHFIDADGRPLCGAGSDAAPAEFVLSESCDLSHMCWDCVSTAFVAMTVPSAVAPTDPPEGA